MMVSGASNGVPTRIAPIGGYTSMLYGQAHNNTAWSVNEIGWGCREMPTGGLSQCSAYW